MAKMAKDMDHRDFRDRARDEYKNRQAEGRLGMFTIWICSISSETRVLTFWFPILLSSSPTHLRIFGRANGEIGEHEISSLSPVKQLYTVALGNSNRKLIFCTV
jgi:hypothetical protein